MEKEFYNKLKYLINKGRSVDEIAKDLELERYQVYGMVQEMKQQGMLYDIVDGIIIKLKQPLIVDDIYRIQHNLERLKLLLISDTHLAGKYDRLDVLRYLYDKAEEQGVNTVLHCGDFTDGKSNRPEHVYELRDGCLSYEGQVQYCVDKYPSFSGKTYIISGNHDDWWYKSAGSEIVKSISNQRSDLVYLGASASDLQIGKLRIHLFHGKGAQAYAKSYKVQKYLDAMPISKRPHILQMGHIHQAFYYQQDDTHVFQTGCLEDPTPYTRSQGFTDNKSCWWVDVCFDNNGNVHSIKQELESFGAKKLVKRK